MGAEDLNIAVVLQSLLDAKGFEDAQAALQKLSDGVKNTLPANNAFAESQKVSAREVRLATSEILRMSGVTQEAGMIGRLAGVGFRALGDSAEFANVAIVGATLGLSVLIPLIIEWIGKSKEATAEQKDIEAAFKSETEALQPYLDKLKGVNAEWAAMAQQKQHDALLQQIPALEAAGKAINNAQEEVDRLNKKIAEGVEVAPGRRFFNPDDLDALQKAKIALADATIHYKLLDEAQVKHKTLQQDLTDTTKKDTKTVDDATAAAKKLQEQRDKDWQRTVEVANAAAAARLHQQQQDDKLDKEAVAADAKRRSDEVTAAEAAAAEQAGIDERLTEQLLEDEQRLADAKQQAQQRTTDAAIQLLGTLFGKSKAAALAQIVVDTAQAIMKTNAQLGWPAAIPFDIALAAEGAAQAAAIAKSGFDDPVNDMLARQRGQKWARDLLNNIDLGFNRGLASAGVGGSSSTTIDRSTNFHGGVHLGGFFGGNENELLTQMSRKLNVIARKEGRATL